MIQIVIVNTQGILNTWYKL